jgi:hypothetical protein
LDAEIAAAVLAAASGWNRTLRGLATSLVQNGCLCNPKTYPNRRSVNEFSHDPGCAVTAYLQIGRMMENEAAERLREARSEESSE